jgi:hypothetical protein
MISAQRKQCPTRETFERNAGYYGSEPALVLICCCIDLVSFDRLESDHHARNKAKTAAAIERARKVDDEAFASMSRPQRENESVTDRVPAELASPSTQIKRPSVWTTPKRSVIAIRDYFDEHPFCGEPVDRPLTIMTVVKRLGDKLSNLMKHCACGMLGPVERRSSEFGQQPEKISPVLNEKETTIGELLQYRFSERHFIICRPSRRSPLSISC